MNHVLQNLQIVEGDFVVEDNPTITSLAGTSQALTTVLGQVMFTAPCSALRRGPKTQRHCMLAAHQSMQRIMCDISDVCHRQEHEDTASIHSA